jgi:pimeloyl-ACP methyl ester carboxylesterase
MSAIHIRRRFMTTASVAALLSLAFFAHGQDPAGAAGAEKEATMQTVTSRDGTRIAYDKSGKGPALILVNGALATRSSNAEMMRLLAPYFTVYSYDRRGRGDSGDTAPYSVRREVEDIEALIDAAGGSARVYGKSSGAALAIEVAAALGDRVTKLAIYEAPYSDADGAAAEWKAFTSKLDGLLAEKRHADAVTSFMAFVGAPEEAISKMKASEAWPGMVAMAPSLAYDNAVLGADRAVPVATAARITATTLVMDGGASVTAMPFMRPTADTLAKAIRKAERRTIEGQAHDVDAKVLAPALVKFFE